MNQTPPDYTRTYAYYRNIFVGKSMPLAFIDGDLFDDNLQALIRRAQGKKIRVHTKSIRSADILRRILDYGPPFSGLMCFHPDEALFLVQKGFDDLLLGYPIYRESAVRGICQAVKSGKTITAMADCSEHLHFLDQLAASENCILPVCLDFDMSTVISGFYFGVRRSPQKTLAQAEKLYDDLKSRRHLRLRGIMLYEAQIASVPDHFPGNPLKSFAVEFLKRASISKVEKHRQEILRFFKQSGASLDFINAGGTGSLESTCREAGITEVSVGSGFFSPTSFDGFESFHHHPAAGFALEIVRKPTPHLFTCQGGGYIASGPTEASKQPTPYLPAGCRLTPLEGAGEVQTPVRYSGSVPLNLGEPIFFRHAKAGELCEHFTHLDWISQGRIVSQVKTYRGEGESF